MLPLDPLLTDALRAALLLGLALAAMPLLRRSASATRRLVLALALGGALAAPVVSAVVPAWHVEAPVATTALHGVPISDPLGDDEVAAVMPSVGEVRAVPLSHREASRVARIGRTTWIVATWAFGALLVVARLLVGLVKARAMVRRSSAARAWSLAVERAERTTGLRADVHVTSELDAPAVTGVFAPVILVPRGSEGWSDERRYAVLLHELAHVRRRDCLVHVIAQLACATHWFNPLAWMVARRLRVERELAADDAVILAGARATAYAEDLLAIAASADTARETPSFALGMAEHSELAARVTAIVSAGRPRRPLTRVRSALLVAGSGTAVLAVACATPAAKKADPPPATLSSAPTPPVATAPEGSTIDPKLQAIADEELDRVVTEWKAAAGALLVLDPSTGEILANAGRAHGAPADVAVKSAYHPGSTFKIVTLAAALDEGVVAPSERIDCERGAWKYQGDVLRDNTPHGTVSLGEMLAVSSNIGPAKIFTRLGGERFGRWARAFHFGVAPAIEGANPGQFPARVEDKSYASAVLAIGEGASLASPLQIAAAYAAVANGGVYVPPTLSHRTAPAPRETIMKAETARALVSLLEGSVNGEHATGRRARVAGVRVAGKSGTSAWALPNGGEALYASFVGFAPADAPRFVILVGVEQPRDEGGGGRVAAPVFARVASRVLGGGAQ
ncbi:penicillin-binding transpeptidase domain-containing protein [Pendulispora albinea]|uniref:Uncharacterized protein n=1 Tax=Pendulispora albinea TaxID=2741071 RepID=A0ABZ2LMT1_9BACT